MVAQVEEFFAQRGDMDPRRHVHHHVHGEHRRAGVRGGIAARGDVAGPLAWAFVIWGTGIYWWSAVLYVEQASAVLQGRRLELSA